MGMPCMPHGVCGAWAGMYQEWECPACRMALRACLLRVLRVLRVLRAPCVAPLLGRPVDHARMARGAWCMV